MAIKVAINGFGRIGRMTTRVLLKNKNVEVVAINDLTDNKTLAHLFKYDSVHGTYGGTTGYDDQNLVIDGKKIRSFAVKDPATLPWKDLGVDVVLECTGKFTKRMDAQKHVEAGARKVVISAPGKGRGDLKTIVLGVNEDILEPSDDIISNASCTTNNAAPMLKIADDHWGVESAFVTTVHAYTGDQNLHDAPHRDLRRARAAAVSIIPTTTGAAKALGAVMPHLEGKLGGAGIRVPVSSGSITDITCILRKQVSVEEINETFKKAAEGRYKNIVQYTDDPIVSIDIVGNTHSCIFDSLLTSVLDKMVKIVGWYDNEMGYSNRLAEIVEVIGNK